MKSVLNQLKIKELTTNLNQVWRSNNQFLKSEFKFQDYQATMKFVNAVAAHANTQNHHPTMIIDFNTVQIQLTTHDSGNKLTVKDFELARAIDQITL
ncbi:4a-hydroxytetrahydrobiopterin dehydratase [Flavobacteriaceae bacterium]|nr:4a-hydroxytetrahydrobiopterin dehydratase [Flavobacteriaceae bacterium]